MRGALFPASGFQGNNVGNINNVRNILEKKFSKWCTVTLSGNRLRRFSRYVEENILSGKPNSCKISYTAYYRDCLIIYVRLSMDTRWLVVIAWLVGFDLLIGVFASRLITVQRETSEGDEEVSEIYLHLYFFNSFFNRSSRWESSARKSCL